MRPVSRVDVSVVPSSGKISDGMRKRCVLREPCDRSLAGSGASSSGMGEQFRGRMKHRADARLRGGARGRGARSVCLVHACRSAGKALACVRSDGGAATGRGGSLRVVGGEQPRGAARAVRTAGIRRGASDRRGGGAHCSVRGRSGRGRRSRIRSRRRRFLADLFLMRRRFCLRAVFGAIWTAIRRFCGSEAR